MWTVGNTCATEYRYRHLSIQDGLSNHVVFDIMQDSQGFIWIASEGGLDRYDGYEFKSFWNDPSTPNGLRSNIVSRILESHNGDTPYLWLDAFDGLFRLNLITEKIRSFRREQGDTTGINGNNVRAMVNGKPGSIWVATTRGLNRYDYVTNSFEHYLDGININEMYMDADGVLWLGTRGKGLIRYNPDDQHTTFYEHDPADPTSISGNSITRGMLDSEYHGPDHLWVGTGYKGLNLLNKRTGKFRRFYPDPPNPEGSYNPHLETETGGRPQLWLRSHPAGYHVMDLETEEYVHHTFDADNPKGLSSHLVKWMFMDRSGTIWLGNYLGIDILNRQELQFSRIAHKPNTTDGLNSDHVASFCIDSRKRMWVGSIGGLNCIHDDGRIENFKAARHLPELIRNGVVGIEEDTSGSLWFATHNGVFRTDAELRTVTSYLPDPGNPASLSHHIINEVSLDLNGDVWVASYTGLDRYNAGIDGFDHFLKGWEISESMVPTGLDTNVVLVLTRSGLVELNPALNEYSVYRVDATDNLSLSNERLHDIFQDSRGIIWLPTNHGLNWTDPRIRRNGKLIFHHYTMTDGLPSNTTLAAIEDDDGMIWISTVSGLSRFDPGAKTFRNYDQGDGLTEDLHYQRASIKAADGTLYFGTLGGGISFFHPSDLGDNLVIPPVRLTDLKIFHKPVQIRNDQKRRRNDPFYLTRSLSYTDEIRLSHRDNVFSLSFAALDFHNPNKNRYRYRLLGLEEEWIETTADRRYVTYTNLTPGTYTFQVKGSNNDQVWNETITKLNIVITPPWWKSRIAYLVYSILVGSSIYALYRIRINRLTWKHQLELEHLEAERYHEMDNLKSRFFADISHEFRTPLTLILGPIGEMLDRIKEQHWQHRLQTMQRHAKHLLDLVTQLLDLSRLEAGRMPLNVSEHNIVPFLKGLVLSFSSLAHKQQVSLSYSSEREELRLYYDKESLVKVMNNLLSNAFKFTSEGDEIKVLVKAVPISQRYPQGSLEISIKDSGRGIPAEHLQHIFDRFYQVEFAETSEDRGTGIGLALSRELMQMHKGEIRVLSEVSLGSQFIVTLPLGIAHLNREELIVIPGDVLEVDTNELVVDDFEDDGTPVIGSGKPTILIVEDSRDVREYTLSCLREDYYCFEAEDGESGLKLAWGKVPELIISDIMMPRMDGIEFCRKIKEDGRSSHIPVVMLTAKADLDSRLEGLETGADDYLTKPFEARELSARVNNLLEQRRILRRHFQLDVTSKLNHLELSSLDEQFMQQALEKIESRLDDVKLNVDHLAMDLHMSRQHLNRKLQALSGLSASSFIRSTRLKHAALLLREHTENVTRIAYSVGFRNPAHFSKCFREQFGVLPSKYAIQFSPSSSVKDE